MPPGRELPTCLVEVRCFSTIAKKADDGRRRVRFLFDKQFICCDFFCCCGEIILSFFLARDLGLNTFFFGRTDFSFSSGAARSYSLYGLEVRFASDDKCKKQKQQLFVSYCLYVISHIFVRRRGLLSREHDFFVCLLFVYYS